jgi:hypothetical protein
MKQRRKPFSWLVRTALIAAIGLLVWHYWPVQQVESLQIEGGSKLKFRTFGDQVQIYENGQWSPFFVKGVNLGAALPGFDPGNLPIPKSTYLKWFKMMSELGANVVRIYTIHQPEFYQALVEYNRENPEHPLYFIQGVWSPEEELAEKKDAFDPEIYDKFRQEITYAVNAVYGNANIPQMFGKAHGVYKTNAGPYLLAWHIGTEWDPMAVQTTNEKYGEKTAYNGVYISAKEGSPAFEVWLADMLDHLASLEIQYGWQHPLTFTNWVTTDPLTHPGEILIEEDLVSVDATRLFAHDWAAGYFAAFHAYPYYPDFFRFDETLHDVLNPDGSPNTYRSYLRKLKAYHKDMPLLITEFGVPSSVGVAHLTGMNRNQGGHDEKSQGEINASLLRDIHAEGIAGAIVFSWQDEWFKRTWNTMEFEIPEDRRKLWNNVLTNEQKFGLIGMYGSKEETLVIDGDDRDWNELKASEKVRISGPNSVFEEIWMTHDEAYVFVLARLKQPFDPERETLFFGSDTLPGGNRKSGLLGSVELDEGLETVISLGKPEESEIRIASNYDFHTRLYGKKYGMIEVKEEEMKDNSGVFLPWRLSVGLELIPPDTRKYNPFEEIDVGKLPRGTTDSSSEAYNSLAMWEAKERIVELRIPWMLLGFTDPSSLQVMDYAENGGEFVSRTTEGIRLVPWIRERATGRIEGLGEGGGYSLSQIPHYTWEPWEEPKYVERKKKSYDIMKQAFAELGAAK